MKLEEVFNDESLYSKKEFKLFTLKNGKYDYDEEKALEMMDYLGLKAKKIITTCNKCKKEFPFDIKTRCIGFLQDINQTTNYMIVTENFQNAFSGRIDIKDGNLFGGMPPYPKDKLLKYNKWYIEYEFSCTNEPIHKYLMVLSIEQKLDTFIIKKIGQDPSMLDVHGYDFDKYKKQLEKINAYDDYKKADLSRADQFYVGAYAYLRRIFEKVLNRYLKEYNIKITDNHVETKIKAVKEYFDPRIKDMLKNLYGILSKSIHELDESQSKTYYDYLKAVIEIQLEYEYTEAEKEKQTKELNSVLNKIANDIK